MNQDLLSERITHLDTAVHELLRAAGQAPENELHTAPLQDDWTPGQVLTYVADFLVYWSRQARDVSHRDRSGEPLGNAILHAPMHKAVPDHLDGPRLASFEELDVVMCAGLREATADLQQIRLSGWEVTARPLKGPLISVRAMVDEFLIGRVEGHVHHLSRVLARSQNPG